MATDCISFTTAGQSSTERSSTTAIDDTTSTTAAVSAGTGTAAATATTIPGTATSDQTIRTQTKTPPSSADVYDADRDGTSLPGRHSHRRSLSTSRAPASRFTDNPGSSSHPSSFSAAPASTTVSATATPSHRASASGIAHDYSFDYDYEAQTQSPPSTQSARLSLQSPPHSYFRSRASTYDTPGSPPATDSSAHLQRTLSLDNTLSADETPQHRSSASVPVVTSPSARRAPASRSSLGVATSDGPPTTIKTQYAYNADAPSSALTTPEKSSPTDGQRELLLPKSLSQSSPSDVRRVSSQRPPVSYKPPSTAVSSQTSNPTPVRVPPIRGFRSSGSRKSLTLDMNFRGSPYDTGDETVDNNYDRTLRALEGRRVQDMLQMTPPASARAEPAEGDDTGDVFLKIAREESTRRGNQEGDSDEQRSSNSRLYRSHRRPMSTAVASYQPASPPYLSRRMSDQQDTSRSRQDDDRMSEVSRATTHRYYGREQPGYVHPSEEGHRSRTGGVTLRSSPMTPRSLTFQDPASGADNSMHTRRRSSVTDQTTPPTRVSIHRAGNSYGKSYNSSPLVRSFDFNNQNNAETGHGVEGTESTASTTAPSTVWDELDDIKSRIHRLELTGKLPSTSGAAISRLSDDRPATATTTVTTVSSSPKRPGATGQAQGQEPASTVSSQRDAYPILQSALSKSKPFLGTDVFRALEAAANDAIALSSMMGVAGQPGPISSGASTIGSAATITDRQLRRKADSVCRSLTELCVALGEDVANSRGGVSSSSRPGTSNHSHKGSQDLLQHALRDDGPSTPTSNKTFNNFTTAQRRQSITADSGLPKPNTSPQRSLSKFEERRNTILGSSALPSPRASTSVSATPVESTPNRKTSLLVSRTRRAGTEEPDEGRRSSLLSSRRRAGTEEPDEGRRTSLLYRGRRGTVGEGDDEARFNTPSRAYTEVNTARGPPREYVEVATSSRGAVRDYAPQPAETHEQTEANPQAGSVLPRRRYASVNTGGSRLVTPAVSSGLPTRKYLERSAPPERSSDTVQERTSEERPKRYSLGQSLSLNRSGTITTRRQNRESMIASPPTAANAGNYR
jgi:hypothetical protein